MKNCFHCCKLIKGKMIVSVPPIFVTQLTGMGTHYSHPKCHEKAEKQAAKELKGGAA